MNEERAVMQAGPAAATSIEDELAVYDGMLKMAGHLVESKLLPNGVTTPAAALAIMLTGREFGWGAMKSFRMIDVIQGKPAIKSDGLMGIVGEWCMRVGGGAYIKVTESTPRQCTVEFRRPGWAAAQSVTYTIDDAQMAGLTGKEMWRKYPRDMLRARAQAVACRMGFADVVGGFYDPDELAPAAPIRELNRSASAEIIDVTTSDGRLEARELRPRELSPGEVVDLADADLNEDTQLDWERINRRAHAFIAKVGGDHDDLHNAMVRLFKGKYRSIRDLSVVDYERLVGKLEEAHTKDAEKFLVFLQELRDEQPKASLTEDPPRPDEAVVLEPETVAATEAAEKKLRALAKQVKWKPEILDAYAIQQFDVPVANLTLASLEALHTQLEAMAADVRSDIAEELRQQLDAAAIPA